MAGGVGGGLRTACVQPATPLGDPFPFKCLTFLSLDAGKDSGAGRGLELSRECMAWLSDLTCWLVFLLFLKFSLECLVVSSLVSLVY